MGPLEKPRTVAPFYLNDWTVNIPVQGTLNPKQAVRKVRMHWGRNLTLLPMRIGISH